MNSLEEVTTFQKSVGSMTQLTTPMQSQDKRIHKVSLEKLKKTFQNRL